jgi:hypothetical protein
MVQRFFLNRIDGLGADQTIGICVQGAITVSPDPADPVLSWQYVAVVGADKAPN